MCPEQALIEKAFWAGVVVMAHASGMHVGNGDIGKTATELRELDVDGEVAFQVNKIIGRNRCKRLERLVENL